MNAIRREEREDSVLTNEAIEVHLGYLRAGLEAVQSKLELTNNKIEQVNNRIDQANRDRAAGDAALSDKIDQANKDRAAADAVLGEKIDQANKDRAAGDAVLSDKIDRLTEVVMKMQGSLDGVKWFIASVTIIAAGVSIGRSLGWF